MGAGRFCDRVICACAMPRSRAAASWRGHATTYLSIVQQVVIQSAMSSESEAKSPEPRVPAGAPRARRRTQHERVAESDRRMLAAALRLIGERGYRGTSLAAIGEAAGYSRGLVHERFGSKAGLLWALVKQILRVWNREGRERGLGGHSGFEALA